MEQIVISGTIRDVNPATIPLRVKKGFMPGFRGSTDGLEIVIETFDEDTRANKEVTALMPGWQVEGKGIDDARSNLVGNGYIYKAHVDHKGYYHMVTLSTLSDAQIREYRWENNYNH